MEMPSLVKEIMMKEMTREFEENPYAFLSSFQGLPVADVSELRRNLQKVSKRSLVVKHSMAKKIFAALHFSEAEKLLRESILVTLTDKEPQVVSKALVDFAKTNQKLVPVGVIFEKKVYDEKFVQRLALLPSRKELLTQVAIRMQAPISGLVMTLNQLLRGVVVALNEVKKKKETAAA
jgi:large subunit ribosomal protein L10